MLTSTATGDLLQALLRAKPHFGPIAKTKHAKITTRSGGSFTFDYAPLDVIQAATEPALSAEGLLLCSGVVPGPEGTAEVVTRLLHAPSEQWLESRIPWGVFEDMKALGGFVTYARRYNHVALLDLVGEDDVDASVADGDHYEPRRKSEKSSPAEKVRPSELVNGNGHTPAPAGDQDLAHPTEEHIAALRKLAVTVCMDEIEVYEDRIRTMAKLPRQASVSPRLLARTLPMSVYMDLIAYYRRLEVQLARSPKEAASGTTSESSADPAAAAAPTEATAAVPPEASAVASSSAPGPDPDDAAERAYHKLYQEALGWGVAEFEIKHILGHYDLAKSKGILWKARRNEPPPVWEKVPAA